MQLPIKLCIVAFLSWFLVDAFGIDRINAYGQFGNGSQTLKIFDNPGCLFTNSSGASVQLLITTPAGTLSGTFLSTSIAPALTSPGYAVHSLPITTSNSQAYTLANGATVHVDLGRLEMKCPLTAEMGLHNLTVTVSYKVDGGSVIQSQITREIAILGSTVNTDPLYGIGSGSVASGIPKYQGGTTNGSETSYGHITLTPQNSVGSVTVTGLVGNYVATLQIGSDVVDTETRSGAEPESVGPTWEWITLDAEPFAGLPLEIKINNVIVWAQTLPAEPGFDIDLAFDPNSPEYLQPVITPDGTPVPLPGDDVSNANPEEPLLPPPVTGDPPTETADENLSVADHYRATRKAIEDALTGPAGPRFSPDEWAGDIGDEMIDSAEGQTAGGMFGGLGTGLQGALGGFEGINAPGIGGASPLTLSVWGHTVALTPAPFAGILRAVLLFFLTLFFFVNTVKIVRGAFASSN
jgi:hypothetical protein